MYNLILSYDERKAIEWVGHRYAHGDDLWNLLRYGMGVKSYLLVGKYSGKNDEIYTVERLEQIENINDVDENEVSPWNYANDIEFEIPESVAWYIQEISDDCNGLWDCFSSEFANKLTDFCNRIV